MKIVSFNIRCIWDGVDGEQSFVHRKEFVVSKIRKENPDIIAFQEVTDEIIEYLKNALPEYGFYGHGRYEDYKGEGVYTAVLREKAALTDMEVFWMTDTPQVPASRLEGQSECPRTCVRTTLVFGGKLVQVYNLHLDHPADGGKVRKREMEIVFADIEKEQKRRELPTIILGDFNDLPESECISLIKQKGYVDVCANSGATFHNFKGDAFENAAKIDYIFCDMKTSVKCVKTEKWTDTMEGLYLSDHYPILAELKK